MPEKIELTKNLVVIMPFSMHKELQALAKQKGITVSDFVRLTLRKEMQENNNMGG